MAGAGTGSPHASIVEGLAIRDQAVRIAATTATATHSWLHHGLRAKDALEAFAVLMEDLHPQYRGHQSRRNARRCKRQLKPKDVVELRRQHRQRLAG
jgi:hypothetical protein